MEEAAIQRFVDGLDDVSGFVFETSAVEQEPPGTDGPEGFEDFVTRPLLLWMSHWVDEQECQSVAVLETVHRRRTFRGRLDEPVAEFAARLRREARQLTDPWLFIGTPGEAAIGHALDFRRPGSVEQARRAGLLQACGIWYAEGRGRGVAQRRHGAMRLHDGGAELIASTTDSAFNPTFLGILRGHPARRRHRLTPGRDDTGRA